MRKISRVIEECWRHSPNARLTALRVQKTLTSIQDPLNTDAMMQVNIYGISQLLKLDAKLGRFSWAVGNWAAFCPLLFFLLLQWLQFIWLPLLFIVLLLLSFLSLPHFPPKEKCQSHVKNTNVSKETDIRSMGARKYTQMFVGRSPSFNYSQKNDSRAPDGDRTRNFLMTGETLWPWSCYWG